MKPTLYALVGALAAVLITTTSALAGSGVGGVFNLGQTNTVNGTSVLTGSTSGPQLKVLNGISGNHGVLAQSAGGAGVALYGQHTSAAGVGPAVRGDSASTAVGAFSIYGLLSSTAPRTNSAAVRGENKGTNANGYGVWGSHAGHGAGVYGTSASGTAVKGTTAGTNLGRTGAIGVAGSATTFGTGVYGTSGGGGRGVWGDSPNGDGVLGEGFRGVAGFGAGTVEASGVYGDCANVCPGVRGSGSPGVHGEDRYGYGDGVSGTSTWGRGVVGTSTNGHGVFGKSTGKDGVHGESTCCSGVLGQSTNGVGVYGYSANSSAGFFEGNVIVTGTLSKGAGAFKIDHPLDPAHKYLQHSFVESPEMMNVYNGNVRTNAKGFATVRLPAWFQALNADFRYQLTVIDRARWTAHAAVWNKVAHNRFTIRTDQPSVEVSWQLTGIRHDAYANAHRIQVVVPKEADERGKYLHPDVYRQPEAKRIGPR